MPKFTLTVSDTHLIKLQAVVSTHNANTGQALTVQQWLDLHLQEVAIANDLQIAIAAIQKQQEQDAQQSLTDAINTTRDELLAQL